MSELTKAEIERRKEDYVYTQYQHGGSRIYLDGESGKRQLLVDTYYDEDFARFINEKVREYFDIESQ